MAIAVIGAGVNGICCVVALAEKGCKVTVYESKTPFSETCSKSSKLLHGRIRKRTEFLGVVIGNGTRIQRIEIDGSVELINGEVVQHAKIINASGPWVKELIERSSIDSAYSLALVKGALNFRSITSQSNSHSSA